MTAQVSSGGYCANCPVDVGLCPRCGIFWMRAPGGAPGKRYGVKPTTDGGPTTWNGWPTPFLERPNVVTRFRKEE